MATKPPSSPRAIVADAVNEAIDFIADEYGTAVTFDSHIVIERIFKNQSGDWVRFLQASPSVNKMHSDIAKMIKKNPRVVMVSAKHLSTTVFGRLDTNALWKFRELDGTADRESALEK